MLSIEGKEKEFPKAGGSYGHILQLSIINDIDQMDFHAGIDVTTEFLESMLQKVI